MTASVLIVDDEPLVSAGLAMLVGAQPGLRCVGTPTDAAGALAAVREKGPDLVLMDVRMPAPDGGAAVDGIEATRLVLDADPRVRVVVLTTFGSGDAVHAALRAGASAYLTKDARPADLLATIRRVLEDDAPLTVETVAGIAARHSATPFRGLDALAPLSPREREVYVLCARGMSNAEIAEAAFLAEATVKSHVGAVLAKLGLRSRVQLVIHAYEQGLAATSPVSRS